MRTRFTSQLLRFDFGSTEPRSIFPHVYGLHFLPVQRRDRTHAR